MPHPKPSRSCAQRLKTRGLSQSRYFNQLDITTTGVRQHLNELAARGLTTTAENHQTRGRPAHYWQLTDAGHRQFRILTPKPA